MRIRGDLSNDLETRCVWAKLLRVHDMKEIVFSENEVSLSGGGVVAMPNLGGRSGDGI